MGHSDKNMFGQAAKLLFIGIIKLIGLVLLFSFKLVGTICTKLSEVLETQLGGKHH